MSRTGVGIRKGKPFRASSKSRRPTRNGTRRQVLGSPEDRIAAAFDEAGLTFVREFKFHPTRKWRADFKVYNYEEGVRILVEYEGGVWTRGRHTTGTGYANDCEKYREAVKLGYRVMRYTSRDLTTMGAAGIAQEIKEMLG